MSNATKTEQDAFFIMVPRWLAKSSLSANWKLALAYIHTRVNLEGWLICAADVVNESGVSKAEVSRLFTALESSKAISYVNTRSIGKKRYKQFKGTPEALKTFAAENLQFHTETANLEFQGETANVSAVSYGNCKAVCSFTVEPTIRKNKEEEREQEGISTKVHESGSLRESLETSAAFDEIFPDSVATIQAPAGLSSSVTITSSNAVQGSALNWDEFQEVYTASGVATLGKAQNASCTPPGRKNPYALQDSYYASGSQFNVSPPASVCTRPVGKLPQGMGTHYGASRV